jgi:nitrile hydratase beta subunit
MDGIHDLGGRQGFGPVDVEEPEEPFHAPWEGRMVGMARGMSRPADWSIDWFRNCRELIEPVDYLIRPYYDQWLQTYAAMMVNSGIATVAELASGRAASRAEGLPPPMSAADVATAKRAVRNFQREIDRSPAFAPGDAVRAISHGHAGHTRLPAYARGRRGWIEACHGAHVFPDASARGDERAEPLYTVGFAATELWPDARGGQDHVFLDLWESYLERA